MKKVILITCLAVVAFTALAFCTNRHFTGNLSHHAQGNQSACGSWHGGHHGHH